VSTTASACKRKGEGPYASLREAREQIGVWTPPLREQACQQHKHSPRLTGRRPWASATWHVSHVHVDGNGGETTSNDNVTSQREGPGHLGSVPTAVHPASGNKRTPEARATARQRPPPRGEVITHTHNEVPNSDAYVQVPFYNLKIVSP
jgi:hypothetical protein